MRTDFDLFATINQALNKREYQIIYNVYPEINEELRSYVDLINNLSFPNNSTYKQDFELPITTGIRGNYYYLRWKVLGADQYNKIPVKVPLASENIFSSREFLNMNKLAYIKKYLDKFNDPIIIANHFPIEKAIVIDGNHRFHAAKEAGKHEINAIILEPKEHLEFLVCDAQKKFYKIHHNLMVIDNLCNCSARDSFSFENNTDLDFSSFYFLNNNISLSFWRKAKLFFKKLN